MPANRFTLVACFRSLGYFVMCAPAVIAQDVAERLNEAHEHYEQSIEQIEQDAITRLDELIDRYSDEGNLQKVLELRAQKTKLLEDRAWPESVVFRTMREKIRSARARARRELAAAYEDAIAALTKDRKYDDAAALREELDELTEIQADFDFRSEEPNHKKSLKNSDSPKPADAAPDPRNKTAQEKKTMPQPPTGVAGKSSRINFAAVLAAEAAKIPLDDATATTEQKKGGLNALIKDLYRQLPPARWTVQQYDDFMDFFATAAAKADKKSCWLPSVDFDARDKSWKVNSGGISVTGGENSVRDTVLAYPSMQWLVTSPTLEDFISRAHHLQAKEYWLVVNKQTGPDQLKMWLQSVGCNSEESFGVAVERLSEAGVHLLGLDSIRVEVAK